MTSLAERLAQSPELFPFALDLAGQSVSFISLTEAEVTKASFLDERIATAQPVHAGFCYAEVAQAVSAAQLPERTDWIFHIGHVGSTLLSRLLGARPDILGLREPAILRTLALAHIQPPPQLPDWTPARLSEALGVFVRLWSRSFRPDQHSVTKATSFASELGAQLLARPSAPRAVMLYVALETYLATILGAENSPREARMLAPLRAARLKKRLGMQVDLAGMSIGEIVAMSWACEMLALSAAAQSAAERALWVDFDRFFRQPGPTLEACFRHFGTPVAPDGIGALLQGPIMSRYSKAPEYPYDRALRDAVLNQARSRQGTEIRLGLDWFAVASARWPMPVETPDRPAKS
jgi:hypothetical protein